MHDAITRSTFAYSTFLFAVLFAPQVGIDHHVSNGSRLISLFPDVITLILMCVVLWLAVRQATSGRNEDVFARGFARGTAVSVISGVLYAIGLAIFAPMIYENAAFAYAVAALSLVAVAAIGSGLSALFAWQRARRAAGGGTATRTA